MVLYMMSVPADAHGEVVEVVDEDNLVSDNDSNVCSRREVHEKELLHRAVTAGCSIAASGFCYNGVPRSAQLAPLSCDQCVCLPLGKLCLKRRRPDGPNCSPARTSLAYKMTYVLVWKFLHDECARMQFHNWRSTLANGY
jgi:hypothetical protein